MSENTPSYLVEARQRYWRYSRMLMASLLLVWAIVSLGCGVLFADVLNEYRLFGTGYPLGFWFAQQGAIIVFVFLILVYALVMNRLDTWFHAQHTAATDDQEAV